MTADQWVLVRELFEQALERDPRTVSAWLAAQPIDPEIRAEVASLVANHSQAASFLTTPLTERVPDLFVDVEGLEAGATVGPYTIVREIGRGGMGRVYLATDGRLGRTVALKMLPPQVNTDPARRERLRREARAAAALTHTGICTIYALEEIDGEVFIAAEYVQGQTLREEIAGGRRPSNTQILETARDIASALASAHAKGITHRDLKPENLVRDQNGHVKILDFGLAQIDEALQEPLTPRVTLPGTVVGTPGYMAPEQLQGEAVDPRTDVFGFGVVMYEYASGVHPFQAATPLAMAARVLEGEPRPLESLCPTLPRAFVETIERCLRKQPADRFQSAIEIAIALGGQVEARPRPRRIAIWWRMHQAIVIMLYLTASIVAWQLKEWAHGPTDAVFVLIGIAAAVGGVFRGHLLFTDWANPEALRNERRRARPITLVVDLAVAALLIGDAVVLVMHQPLTTVLTSMLAIFIALARTVLEPATTGAAFGEA